MEGVKGSPEHPGAAMLHDQTSVRRFLQALWGVFARGRLHDGRKLTASSSGPIRAPEVIGSELLFQDFDRERGSEASAPWSQPGCLCRKRMTIAQSLEHPWIKVRTERIGTFWVSDTQRSGLGVADHGWVLHLTPAAVPFHR